MRVVVGAGLSLGDHALVAARFVVRSWFATGSSLMTAAYAPLGSDLVVEPSGTIVHLRLLPDTIEDYEALLRRAGVPA